MSSPFRSWAKAARSTARHSRECATSARRCQAAHPLPRPAPRAAQCAARHLANPSCAFSSPVTLEAGIGDEQLFRADVRIVEVDAHTQLPPFPRDCTYDPAAELPVPNALPFHVSRRVLRHLVGELELRQSTRGGATWSRRLRGPHRRRVPRRRRAAFLDNLRRQRVKKARPLPELQPPVAVARARP